MIMDKTFGRLVYRYTIRVSAQSTLIDDITGATRAQAAIWLRIARTFPDEIAVTISCRAVYVEHIEHVCYGCLARPARWEWDCDGPYATAECGQCDWWAAVALRDRSVMI